MDRGDSDWRKVGGYLHQRLALVGDVDAGEAVNNLFTASKMHQCEGFHELWEGRQRERKGG